jgi:YVTN family beta-propeller protein
MKTFKSTSFLIALLAVILVVPSCKKPEKVDIALPLESKVFVLNEGNFNSGNASVSLYDPIFNKVYNDMFTQQNSRPLGDVLQSMCIVGDKAYFVVNNSNKIEITDKNSMVSTGVINDLSLPRYMVAVNDQKAYVTEYISYVSGNGRISIIDLATNTVSGTITLGTLPETMLLHNGKMYVCISNENKIAVINTSTDAVETTITVSDGPNSIVKDSDGKLWVMCGGKTEYNTTTWEPDPLLSTPGALVKINPTTGMVESTMPFSEVFGSPAKLTINGSLNTLYYAYNGAIYSQSITASALSSTPVINRSFYGLGVDPQTEYIYAGTYGFTSNQRMIRYTSAGAVVDSTEVGVGPNGFYFNY